MWLVQEFSDECDKTQIGESRVMMRRTRERLGLSAFTPDQHHQLRIKCMDNGCGEKLSNKLEFYMMEQMKST